MTKAFIISKIISKKPSFTTSLNTANRMGKAPIFLKHRAKNIGRAIKRNPKKSIAAGLAGAVGLQMYSDSQYVDINKDPNLQNIRNELNTNPKTKNMPVKVGFFSRTPKKGTYTNKAAMNKEIAKIQREKKSGVKNTNKQIMDRIAKSQRY
jgi:hypothetical protein